jgi:aminopeptidase N
MKKHTLLFPVFAFVFSSCALTQPLNRKDNFTRADTLRGSITPERSWWDVLRYDVEVTPDYNKRSIAGKTTIHYKIVQENHTDYMQVDLQQPMRIDTIYYDNKLYINYPGKPYTNEGNVWHIPLPKAPVNSNHSLTIVYGGVPRPALNAPWDGGWIWTKDEMGRPWITVACQGLGASVWYPCKDHQSDEPDNGASLTINIPDTLVAVAGGKLKSKSSKNGIASYTWEVKSPINNYTIIPYIGKYVNWSETYKGEKGNLNCSYWVLDYNLERAKKQFTQVPQMLKAFEHWFSPYPFYEDDFKMVDAPHLGMEHQSAIAYGNGYRNGYQGKKYPSNTDWALKFDYIIIHESGHEWFGNNITTKDVADMWVHEGFTTYSETIYVDYNYGKEAATEYVMGQRGNIKNDNTLIGIYGVNKEGSGDMYAKGANMIHTLRQVINDDEKFRALVRGLNKDFYHQTVTTKQIEDYISEKAGKNLSKFFEQYLRSTQIPTLELKADKDKIEYRWTTCVDEFNMPVKLTNGVWLQPTTDWAKLKVDGKDFTKATADNAFYVKTKTVK